MARTPKVTRTITTSVVSILCANIEIGELVNVEFTLPRTYKNDDDILKAVKKANHDDNIKPVSVSDIKIVETLYGMDEQKFIDNAEILPPRKDANGSDENTEN